MLLRDIFEPSSFGPAKTRFFGLFGKSSPTARRRPATIEGGGGTPRHACS
jgi:hypothetical protein